MNQVKFITFNYDTSLERFLWRALKALSIFEHDDVSNFMSADRFCHVYGSVNDGMQPLLSFDGLYSGGDLISKMHKMIETLEIAYDSSKYLSVIDPSLKIVNDHEIRNCRQVLGQAEVVFILGFGFDDANTALLDLKTLTSGSETARTIYITNFNDYLKTNFAIGKIFSQSKNPLIAQTHFERGSMIWKSVKNTYDALGSDFLLS